MLWRVLCVVSKGLDHTTIGDAAAAALVDHLFKLGFEHLQPEDATLDLRQLAPGYAVCVPRTSSVSINRTNSLTSAPDSAILRTLLQRYQNAPVIG